MNELVHVRQSGLAPLQLLLYTNDAVDVTYSDGSKLSLSPCGSTFTHLEQQGKYGHPLLLEKNTQHRTQFVTSTFKSKVTEALEFRNMFAQRPFICADLWNKCSVIRLHADITSTTWPTAIHKANIKTFPDGSVSVTSLDEYATISLSPNRQSFTLHYLGRIGSKATKIKAKYSVVHAQTFSGNNTVCDSAQEQKLEHSLNSSCSKHLEIVSPKKKQLSEEIFDLSGLSVSGLNENHIVASSPVTERNKSRINKYPNAKLELGQSDNAIKNEGCESIVGEQCENKFDTGVIGEGHWDYVWVDQHYSVNDYPQDLKAIVDLVLTFVLPNEKNVEKSPDRNLTVKVPTIHKPTMLPVTLPLNCVAQHLHERPKPVTVNPSNETEDITTYTNRPKVICIQGVLYRLLWSTPRAVEILPGDGSLMRSSSLSGHFFQHYYRSQEHIEERTYSVQRPPVTPPYAPYSIEKLINRGARFLELLYTSETRLADTESPCCWNISELTPSIPDAIPSFLLEECTVENLGKFSAHSSGRIRVVFTDRISLEMWYDLSGRLNTCANHGQEYINEKHAHQILCPPDLMNGVVRLLLPDGHYHTVIVSEPHQYAHYVSVALEWAEWVNSKPTDRFEFYKGTIHSSKILSIEHELRKINCFNYLLDNGSMSHPINIIKQTEIPQASEKAAMLDHNVKIQAQQHRSGNEVAGSNENTFDFNSVQEVLQQTSRAVKDLDTFLHLARN